MTKAQLSRLLAVSAVLLVGIVAAGSAPAAQDNSYTVHPLSSNGGVPAPMTDPHLVNAWGLTAGPTTPWWVSDNGIDLSTLYKADGSKQALEVHVNAAPTGAVFANIPGNFPVGTANQSALFIWSTETGTIQGWHPTIGTTAQVKVTSPGAIYKGLAIATTATGPRLYAADFKQGRVDIFNGAWAPVTTAGGFVDPNLPDGYAPFGIQTIGTRIFVTYAKQSGGTDELHGQSLGIVDAYDLDGRLLTRVAQHGQLNAPWGLALAPSTFGRLGGDLLVGNFGDGQINAYEQLPNGRFEHRGELRTADGNPVAIDGLWALQFGHGAPSNGPVDTLFFTAGPNDEADGLFGSITAN
jgi:uncharacterized protein (TIGR03118 family)